MRRYRNIPMFEPIATRSAFAAHQRDRSRPVRLVAAVKLMLRAHVTRQALPEISDHLLADLGITRPMALDEAARLPWDISPARSRHAGGLGSVIGQTLQRIRNRRMASGPASEAVFWGG